MNELLKIKPKSLFLFLVVTYTAFFAVYGVLQFFLVLLGYSTFLFNSEPQAGLAPAFAALVVYPLLGPLMGVISFAIIKIGSFIIVFLFKKKLAS